MYQRVCDTRQLVIIRTSSKGLLSLRKGEVGTFPALQLLASDANRFGPVKTVRNVPGFEVTVDDVLTGRMQG